MITDRRLLRKLFFSKADSNLIQFFRFAIVSGVSLGVDFGLLYVATEHIGLHYLLSAIISYSVGMVVSYLLSILWAFPRSRLKSRALEFIIFVSIGLAGMGLNELLLWLFTEVIKFHYLISRLLTAIVGFLWKFVLRKVILFT